MIPLQSNNNLLDVRALFTHKGRAGNTFGEVPGPEHTDCYGVDMSLSAYSAPTIGAQSSNFCGMTRTQIGDAFADLVAEGRLRWGQVYGLPTGEWGTAMGWVYFLTLRDRDCLPVFIKIGFTKGDPEKRLSDLKTGCPLPVDVCHRVPGNTFMERALHQRFADFRSHGEWFYADTALLSGISRFLHEVVA